MFPRKKINIIYEKFFIFYFALIIIILASTVFSILINTRSDNFYFSGLNISSNVESAEMNEKGSIPDLLLSDVFSAHTCEGTQCYRKIEGYVSAPVCEGRSEGDCNLYEICAWTPTYPLAYSADNCSGILVKEDCEDSGCTWSIGGGCVPESKCADAKDESSCNNISGYGWVQGKIIYECTCPSGTCGARHSCVVGKLVDGVCEETSCSGTPVPIECNGSACWSPGPEEDYCPSCTPTSCCSPSYTAGCTQCTPTCGAGYGFTQPVGYNSAMAGCGPVVSSCSGTDNCSNACTVSGANCYKNPIVTKAQDPSYITLCSPNKEACIKLSTDPSKPTLINPEQVSSQLYFMVDATSFPSNSRGLLASYTVTGTSTNLSAVSQIDTAASAGIGRYRYYTPEWFASINRTQGRSYTVTAQFAPLRECTDSFICTDGMCSNQVSAYFKINSKPTVSISSPANISGSLPNDDNGTDCAITAQPTNDNNPTNFSLMVTDNDGSADILWAGLWIDENTTLGADLKTSVHALAHKGTEIKIHAATQNSGVVPALANMELLVDGVLVKTFTSVSTAGGIYTYTHPTALRPNQITIRFPNDYYVFPNDRNLYINAIKLNGKKYIVAQGLNSSGSTYTIPGTETIGNNAMALYGLTYVNEINNTWDYSWTLPNFTGMSSGSTGMIMSAKTSAANNNDEYTGTEIWDPSVSQDRGQNRWKLMSSNCSGNTCTYNINAGFGSNMPEGVTNVFAFARDTASGLGETLWTDQADYRIDFTSPSVTITGPSIIDKNTVSYNWNLSDTNSGVKSSIGLVGLFGSDYEPNEFTVTNINPLPELSASLPYINVTGTEDFNPVPIWTKGAQSNGTQQLNIGVINEGNLGVKIKATDNACNMGSFTDNTNNLAIGESWFASKSGLFYSAGNVESLIKVPDPDLTYFADPFGLTSVNTQISTELGLTGGTGIQKIVERNNNYDPFTLTSYPTNTISYQELLSQVNREISNGTVVLINMVGNTLTGDISAICPDDTKPCVINATGNLSVDTVNCNRQALIKTTGNIIINPDVTKTDTSKLNGCIFMSGANISIGEGSYKSAGGTPVYDNLNGILIAGGHIILPRTDAARVTVDGLKVQGAVYSLGGDANGLSWQRSLQLLDNNTYPTFVVVYDPRYLYISSKFFGVNSDAYVKELGYKPY